MGTVASCYIDSINPFGYYVLSPLVLCMKEEEKKLARPCSSSAIGHPQGRTPPCEKNIYEEKRSSGIFSSSLYVYTNGGKKREPKHAPCYKGS